MLSPSKGRIGLRSSSNRPPGTLNYQTCSSVCALRHGRTDTTRVSLLLGLEAASSLLAKLAYDCLFPPPLHIRQSTNPPVKRSYANLEAFRRRPTHVVGAEHILPAIREKKPSLGYRRIRRTTLSAKASSTASGEKQSPSSRRDGRRHLPPAVSVCVSISIDTDTRIEKRTNKFAAIYNPLHR